jgi:signal transduction histidine kinase
MPLHWFTKKIIPQTHRPTQKRSTKYRSHGLSLRIVVSVLLSTLVFASLISAWQIYRGYQIALGDLQRQSHTIEKNYLPLLGAALWSVDEPRIDAIIDSIAQLPHIGRVYLKDDVATEWQRATQKNTGTKTLHLQQFPIEYQDNGENFLLGQLEVQFVDTQIISELRSTARDIATSTLTTLLLSAIFILLIIHFWISRHLEKMATYAQSLDMNTLDQALRLERKTSKKPDELDIVVEAINQMRLRVRIELDRRNQLLEELTHHREQLELLVDERTRDLQQQTHTLERQTETLRQQNRELDAYAHTVAHDLKQPLSNLVASSSLLNAEQLNLPVEKKKILLAGVQKSAHKMKNIIESLLLLARIRQTDNVQSVELDIHKIALEACGRLQPLAEQREAKIHISEHWPTAMGNEQWVEEVWVNYLSNAIKYGGSPPQIQLGASAAEKGKIKYWVKDFGAGLTDIQQTEIFELFVRFDTQAAEGHGLGLSIVKRIVTVLNGDVGYEKSADGGSVFWFSLPTTS